MDTKIKEILNFGVYAPSGDNSQPWRFVVNGNTVKVYNIPGKDNPYLNFQQSGSLIAHGALLKNIEIASTKFNLEVKIDLFPKNEEVDLVAEIFFQNTNSNIKEHPLLPYIKNRSTNRKFYKNVKLEKDILSSLKDVNSPDGVYLNFIEEKEEKKIIGKVASNAEIIILENDTLHGYLFKDVMWTEQQEKKEKHGLYIKTMEFNPVQKFLFRLAGKKNIMSFAKKLNFPKFIAKQDASLYASCSAMCLFSIEKISPIDFVKLGMSMQEIWLKATSLGLYAQPISATLFLGFKMKDNSENILIDEHINIVNTSYAKVFSVFNLNKKFTPLMLLRIGYAKPPSARSSRKEIK